MLRALRELDFVDAGHAPRRSAHRSAGITVWPALLAVLFVGGGSIFIAHQSGLLVSGLIGGRDSLGTPPDVSHGAGAFAFIATQPNDPDEPVTYSPCDYIHVEVNDELAPIGSEGLLESAIARVSAATGLQFVVEGTTDRLPADRIYLPSRLVFVSNTDPVLIAWTTPEVVPRLTGDTVGLGGSAALESNLTRRVRFVTGTISLDAPQLSQMLGGPDGRALVEAVILHELGHVVGLDHVQDPNELMYESNVGQVDFGPGDREGLAALGRGSCR
jgi:hypothetical protein